MISNSEMQKIARNIIRKSMFVKEKEVVKISSGPKALKFAEMLAYEASIIGAHPTISYCSDELALNIYNGTKLKYLKRIPKLSKILARKIDVEINIEDSDPFIERKLPQDKVQARVKAMKPLSKIRDRRVVKKTIKSALVGYPTKETAKSLGTPFSKLSRIFWSTLSTDPYKLHLFNKRLAKKLKKAENIHITGKRTDIELSVKGREPIDDCGLWTEDKTGYLNLPAGEIFYAPVETSANGEIYFDLPCLWHYGKQVKGVWFKFKNGKVVDYHIEKGLKNFEDVMRNATGEKFRIAELGIGTNPNAKPTGGMTIVDEKIRGTIHMAIGMNKHFGGKNDATIHWDFFKDMKTGKMYADGKLIMKRGKLLI
jgi:aminopeptidase